MSTTVETAAGVAVGAVSALRTVAGGRVQRVAWIGCLCVTTACGIRGAEAGPVLGGTFVFDGAVSGYHQFRDRSEAVRIPVNGMIRGEPNGAVTVWSTHGRCEGARVVRRGAELRVAACGAMDLVILQTGTAQSVRVTIPVTEMHEIRERCVVRRGDDASLCMEDSWRLTQRVTQRSVVLPLTAAASVSPAR